MDRYNHTFSKHVALNRNHPSLKGLPDQSPTTQQANKLQTLLLPDSPRDPNLSNIPPLTQHKKESFTPSHSGHILDKNIENEEEKTTIKHQKNALSTKTIEEITQAPTSTDRSTLIKPDEIELTLNARRPNLNKEISLILCLEDIITKKYASSLDLEDKLNSFTGLEASDLGIALKVITSNIQAIHYIEPENLGKLFMLQCGLSKIKATKKVVINLINIRLNRFTKNATILVKVKIKNKKHQSLITDFLKLKDFSFQNNIPNINFLDFINTDTINEFIQLLNTISLENISTSHHQIIEAVDWKRTDKGYDKWDISSTALTNKKIMGTFPEFNHQQYMLYDEHGKKTKNIGGFYLSEGSSPTISKKSSTLTTIIKHTKKATANRREESKNHQKKRKAEQVKLDSEQPIINTTNNKLPNELKKLKAFLTPSN